MKQRNVCKKIFVQVAAVYAACVLCRVFEYFCLRTDQTFIGEAFIHKLCGIGILCIALKLFSVSWRDIAFDDKNMVKNLCRGLVFGLAVFFVAYTAEILLSIARGNFSCIRLYVSSFAVNTNTGSETAFSFFLLCIAGNILNVVMEEGVFRGFFQHILQQKFSFIAAAVIASLLFGLWHIVSPIRSYYDGALSINGLIANMSMLAITSALVGFKFALLTKITGSLYMAMGDHFVNNTIVNLVHIMSESGADELLFVRITIAQSLSFAAVLVYYIRRKSELV